MSIPSIIVGEGNWAGKSGNLLGYAVSDVKILPREFTVSRALNTATRVNASGNIEGVNANVPRIDYFGGQASLLVEPSATNVLLNSSDTTTNWSVGSNLTTNAVDVIGIPGNNLTVAVSGGGIGLAVGRIQRFNNSFTFVSGSTYTISFFIKKTGTHTIGGYYAFITGAAAGDLGSGFDVSGSFNSGSIYNSAGITNRIRRVEQWGTDVYRCSETFTMTASGTLSSLNFAPVSNVTLATNPAVGQQLGFAAPQLELGSVPTSFISTTTGTVTRSAEAISVTGVAGLIGQTEGTIYAEVDVRNFVNFSRVVALSDGTNSNSIGLQLFLDGAVKNIRVGLAFLGSGQVDIIAAMPNAVNKIAVGYKQNDFVVYLNGSSVGTDTSCSVPAMNKIDLGNINGVNIIADRIRAAALYTTRLSNAELAALTSP